jgi:hypothetical protein
MVASVEEFFKYRMQLLFGIRIFWREITFLEACKPQIRSERLFWNLFFISNQAEDTDKL